MYSAGTADNPPPDPFHPAQTRPQMSPFRDLTRNILRSCSHFHTSCQQRGKGRKPFFNQTNPFYGLWSLVYGLWSLWSLSMVKEGTFLSPHAWICKRPVESGSYCLFLALLSISSLLGIGGLDLVDFCLSFGVALGTNFHWSTF